MIHSFVYRKGQPCQKDVSRQELAKAVWDKNSFVWVDLEDPTEFESELLIEIFNFHPLAVEDAVSDLSHPKLDDYDEYLFLVVHAIDFKEQNELATVELDIFFSKKYIVTVHKRGINSIDHMRGVVARRAESYFENGVDMLVHAILDRLVDNISPVLNRYDDQIDQIEEQIFRDPSQEYLDQILRTQKDVWQLRKVIGPLRETINQLSKRGTSLIKADNLIYFRDVYDHVFQIYQTVEGFQELLNGILQIYFSHASTKMNEVIKTMTVIATVGLPPLVIASIYGMNFQIMPEIYWKHGYLFALGLMALSSGTVLAFMKLKKWF